MDRAIGTREVEECIEIAQEMIDAESRLLEILRGDAKPDEIALACGKVHEIARENQIAEGFYRHALRHSPDNLEALARLALVVLKRGDVAEGLALARQLEMSDPKFVFATITGKPATSMTVLGDALRDSGELSRAKSAYEASVALTDGKDAHSLGYLADGLLREGKAEEAVALLERFATPDELDSIRASAALLQKDPNSLASFRPGVDRRLVGWAHTERV